MTSIQHVTGTDNPVADALSRIEEITCPSTIDYETVAQSQRTDPSVANMRKNDRLQFEMKTIGANQQVLCETSTGSVRPYLPLEFRKVAYNTIHDLCHPGVRATRKLITQRYFWPGMNTDIGNWAKACIECQRAKTTRHTIAPMGKFEAANRFEHVHMDIVGPLPISSGQRFLVTMVDRTSSWLEAFPVSDITAETVARTTYEGWITKFGCPARITTDQGRQFESQLFNRLTKRFGITDRKSVV